MKRCLRKTIGQAKLTYDELATAVVEIEGILNSRPLSYVSSDDLEEPLTPSHLITGRRLLSLPDIIHHTAEEEVKSTPEVLTRRMRHLNYCLTRFWTRWRKEYLLELREAHRHHHGCNKPPQVTQGDVVVIHSTGQPRGFWRLGRVVKVLPGRDGVIRGAILRVAGKGRRATLLERPISLLYPLETCVDDCDKENCVTTALPTDTDSGTQDKESTSEPARRSRRVAACEARDRILAQTLSDD